MTLSFSSGGVHVHVGNKVTAVIVQRHSSSVGSFGHDCKYSIKYSISNYKLCPRIYVYWCKV